MFEVIINTNNRRGIDMSKYFSRFELRCHCGQCSGYESLIAPELFTLLEAIREKAGRPLTISSGIRCMKHPAEAAKVRVTGQPLSAHVQGKAADIVCRSPAEVAEIVKIAKALGVIRIGIAKTFVHVDLCTDLPQTSWTYK